MAVLTLNCVETVFVIAGLVHKIGQGAMNDVWSSVDLGASWTNLVADGSTSAFSQRGYASVATLDNKIFLVGGISGSTTLYLAQFLPPVDFMFLCRTDVWVSSNGQTWMLLNANPGFNSFPVCQT